MTRSLALAVLAAAALLAADGAAVAQTRVRTETVRPPAAVARPAAPSSEPGVVRDLSVLPPPVARMRERILAAARSGDLQQMVTVMQSNEMMPIFSLNNDKDPIAYWRAAFPDSDGVEILSIIVEILETGFIRADRGTAQEMYLWPYFARLPLDKLSPAQRVELFKIVTGSDYRGMLAVGAYNFYRLGIGPDGTWHFLVTGD